MEATSSSELRTQQLELGDGSSVLPFSGGKVKRGGEMQADFKQTTWRYFPEDRSLHNHNYENLKSYIVENSSP
jgi:hypothetical protein